MSREREGRGREMESRGIGQCTCIDDGGGIMMVVIVIMLSALYICLSFFYLHTYYQHY